MLPRLSRCASASIALVAVLSPLGRAVAQTPAQQLERQPAAAVPAVGGAAGEEFFEKKVRPLLVARCHECHGPQKQKGNLRLDSRQAVLRGGDTGAAIVPGKPEESLLVDAVNYGETYQMPPKSQLPADEIDVLVNWVRMGAPWGRESTAATDGQGAAKFDLAKRARHWCFQPLVEVQPPAVSQGAWPRTSIDPFVLARLEAAGLQPAPAADKRVLLRRVTYDLVGLPPTPAEIDAFLADESPSAYQAVVDRLLASPRYGERWARHWLDLVRYAETLGHEFDFDLPDAYRYRDYVIRALNDDVPYDQFVVEHIAGDLLADPRRHPRDQTNESIIGTGFFFFGEAKHSPVDVRQDEADRMDNQIDVLAKTFLGLTVSCARCHDHKFDAISTQDYYALAGYLESSRYQRAYIDPPESQADAIVQLRAIAQERRAAARDLIGKLFDARLAQLVETLVGGNRAEVGDAWTDRLREAQARPDGLFHAWSVLTSAPGDAAAGDFSARRAALVARWKSELADRAADSVTFEDFVRDGYAPWQATGAAFGDGPMAAGAWMPLGSTQPALSQIEATRCAHSGQLSARLQGVLRSPTFEIVRPTIAYRVRGTGGRVRLVVDNLQLIRDPIYGGLQFSPKGTDPYWHKQDVSKWIGHRAYIEVIDEGDEWIALENVVFCNGELPRAKPASALVAALDDPAITSSAELARAYQTLCQRSVADWLNGVDATSEEAADRAWVVRALVSSPLVNAWVGPNDLADITARLSALDVRQAAVERGLAQPRLAMAMADGTAENHPVYVRGSHKILGGEVPRRFLEVFGGTRHAPPTQGSGRLELARQFVTSGQALLARVIVNRLWHHHFGAGIVRSPDDFGVMGQRPTHPELLDHLAIRLVSEGWSLKAIHRLILLSGTYQMSSRAEGDADLADPENKLWHRMNVRRLEAEAIRDAILAVSGAADASMYGPGVMPHLNAFMTGRGRPSASGPMDGGGRRSIYLAVRRNFLSPLLLAFDYPTPFTTIGRRGVSNVPAQALAMMNNPFVVEQARIWGERSSSALDTSISQRVRQMYVRALARGPQADEEQAAVAFLSDVGGGAQGWAELAHVLLNLKEFIFIP